MACVSWAEIPEDIFLSIAGRLPTVIDFFNVSQVCKPWRSTALSPLNLSIPSQPPFLMLASESKNRSGSGEEDEKSSFRGIVEFKNQGNPPQGNPPKVCSLWLPEIPDDVRIMGCTGNWLIIIDLELDIFIFNPFTKTRLQFPSQSTLPCQFDEQVGSGSDCDSDCDSDCEGHDGYTREELRNIFIQKAFLSSSNVRDVVMVIIFGADRELAIARPGDLSWTPVQHEMDALRCLCFVTDVIVFKDQFYSVNSPGNIAASDIYSTTPKAIEMVGDFKIEGVRDDSDNSKYYLVECLGKLLMVIRRFTRYDEEELFYKTREFRVYMFDFDNKEREEVTSLGEYCLFLGFNTSVSLLVSEYSPFQNNCIYFTDNNNFNIGTDSRVGHDTGVFDLNDKTIKPHFNEVSASFQSPPLWIVPQSIR